MAPAPKKGDGVGWIQGGGGNTADPGVDIRIITLPPVKRQADSPGFTAIPSTYGSARSSPSPGAVVGIVLGSVAAFLLLLYLVYAILHRGPGPFTDDRESTGSVSVVSFRTRDRKSRGGSIHRHASERKKRTSKRSSRGETVEVRETIRTVPITIVDPPVRPEVVDVEEDVVVVEEEHTPPMSRRGGGWRRESGYRDVEPGRFAGGEGEVRGVPRRGSGRYSRDR